MPPLPSMIVSGPATSSGVVAELSAVENDGLADRDALSVRARADVNGRTRSDGGHRCLDRRIRRKRAPGDSVQPAVVADDGRTGRGWRRPGLGHDRDRQGASAEGTRAKRTHASALRRSLLRIEEPLSRASDRHEHWKPALRSHSLVRPIALSRAIGPAAGRDHPGAAAGAPTGGRLGEDRAGRGAEGRADEALRSEGEPPQRTFRC